MQSKYYTRPAHIADLTHLPKVEASAGTLFRTIEGIESVADDDPLPVSRLQEILQRGKIWVAVHVETAEGESEDSEGKEESIVGFLAAYRLVNPTPQADTNDQAKGAMAHSNQFLYIAELSVHASHHRRGLASRLMDDLICYAEEFNNRASLPPSPTPSLQQEAKIDGLTLTTYYTVPFNGPFYQKFGFHKVPVDEILTVFGTEARRIWDEEQSVIPMPEGRAWMVLWMDRRGKTGGKG